MLPCCTCCQSHCVSHCLCMLTFRVVFTFLTLSQACSMWASDSDKCAPCPTSVCDISGHDIKFQPRYKLTIDIRVASPTVCSPSGMIRLWSPMYICRIGPKPEWGLTSTKILKGSNRLSVSVAELNHRRPSKNWISQQVQENTRMPVEVQEGDVVQKHIHLNNGNPSF